MRVSKNLLPLMGLHPSGDVGPFTVYTSKRKGVVFFPRSPPTKPPTVLQRRCRNRFRLAAWLWRSLPAQSRGEWERATKLAKLALTGYNLFLYHSITKDDAAIRTVERISGVQLL
jgi:hypothetical protein